MKTAIKIILLSFTLSSNSLFAQEEKFVANGSFENIYLNQVDVNDLILMDKNFEKLNNHLGKPIKTDFEEKFTEATWNFKYEGFELTYIQLSPRGPELLEIIVNSPEVNFKIGNNELYEINTDSMINGRSVISGKEIKSDLDDYKKFEGQTEFLEFEYFNKELKSITFKRNLQI